MKKPKTKRQRAFFKNIAEGMTKRQAAIKAGYSEKSANHSADQNAENCKDYWKEALDAAGATDALICQTITEGLKATKVVGYLQFVEVADYSTRAKFVDIALKLKAAYPATKVEITQPIRLAIDE